MFGDTAFLEALDAEAGAHPGGKWRIRIIRPGRSLNGIDYPAAVLREAAPKFEGVRCFIKSDAEHLAGGGKDVRNLIGALSNVVFVEGAGLLADLTLIEPAGAVAVKLREAKARGLDHLMGFSIDARGQVTAAAAGRRAHSIDQVRSVDLIVEPGAGGALVDMIEAAVAAPQESDMDKDTLIGLIEAARPELLAGKDKSGLTGDEVEALFREALRPAAPVADGAAGGGSAAGLSRDEVAGMLRLVEARAEAAALIAASPLPPPARERLTARFREAVAPFDAAAVAQAIDAERAYLGRMVEGGQITGLGEDGAGVARVRLVEGQPEKIGAMLDAFFDQGHPDHRHARSFRDCYIAMTGDRRVTGMRRDADESVMREALGTADLADVLGDAINRRLLADYRTPGVYAAWRRIATTGRANDFRAHQRTRIGGYGDLPTVGEGAAYLALASPADEKVEIDVAKRGGLETLTLEAIKNDDVGLVRRIPTNLSRAAGRTLAKFVFDFVRGNAAIYDGLALAHADHGNLGAAALSATTLAAGRLAMLKQTEAGSGDRLNIGPRSLLVPPDLEQTAVDLFNRSTENDRTFIQSLSLDVIPVWYWTDASDWALVADPLDIPTIEVNFLDGQEEPELFIQDSPTLGSMFSHDQLTWKIRHIYGGAVMDYRGFYKAVVA